MAERLQWDWRYSKDEYKAYCGPLLVTVFWVPTPGKPGCGYWDGRIEVPKHPLLADSWDLAFNRIWNPPWGPDLTDPDTITSLYQIEKMVEDLLEEARKILNAKHYFSKAPEGVPFP